MKKKIFGAVLATVLVLSQTVIAMAAPSGTTAPTTAVNAEVAAPASFTEVVSDSEVAAVIDSVNSTASNAAAVQKLIDSAIVPQAVKDELAGKALATPFVDIKNATANADGKFEVGIPANLPVGANASNTRILHYSTVRNVWETLVPTSVANGIVTGLFDDLSPVAVVTVAATSPKTGVSDTYVLWMAAAVVMLAAGTVAFKKSRR